MKKVLFSMIVVLLFSGSIKAKSVSIERARRVAETHMRAMGMKNVSTLVIVETPFSEFYVFANPEGGFVLVSADDCVLPVLGYSVFNVFGTKDMPDNIRSWFEGYEEEIRWWKRYAADNPAVSGEWAMLEAGEAPPMPLTTAVAPLLATTWNQSPLYNDLCPYHDSTAARSVTGCVATATAQVMKYWNHPTTGYGSHTYTSECYKSGITYTFPNLTANFGNTTYQWSSMPNALTSASSSTQVNAVATLMYHIGVAIEMSYSPSGSGAQNYNIWGTIGASSQTALMKYFKYRSDIAPLARADYSDAEYSALLRAEIDQNHPVLYSGSHTSGAHSFVLDGYDNNGKFHINWGWGGSSDGYFVMGSLNPGAGGIGGNGSGTYNMGNVAVTGIQPHTGWSTTGTTTVTATSTGHGSVTGSGSYSFGDTVTLLATADAGYRFSGWSDGSKFNPREIIANGGSYSFTATFQAMAGDTVHFCPGNLHVTSYGTGTTGADMYWGIHLPASVLNADSSLKAVQFFVDAGGTYDVTVYRGASHSIVASRDTVTYTDDEARQWQTVTLATPVPSTGDLWIILHNADVGYPQTATYYSGAAGSFISGSGFYDYGPSRQLSAMVKAIFCSCVVPVDSSCFIRVFPYTEDFDDEMAPCWETYNANGGNSKWGFYGGTYGYNNTSCIGIKYADTSDDWLMMPPMALAGNYSLAWKARIRSTTYPETYQVLWYNGDDTALLFQETLTSTTYVDRTVNFAVPAGGSGRIVFRYISDDEYYLYLDNVVISRLMPSQYTITVTSNNPAWGTVSGGGTYDEGTTVTLQATPAEGYRFVQWHDEDTSSVRTVTVTSDAAYTALFAAIPLPQYTVTVNSNNSAWGTVTGGGTFDEGTVDTLVATAFSGCHFVEWHDHNPSAVRVVTVTSDATYTAIFEADPPAVYTVTVLSSNSAWGTVTGSGTFVEGTVDTLVATANSGYRFVEWNDHNPSATRTVTVTGNATYIATFEANPPVEYTVTVLSSNSAWGSVSGGGTFAEGAVDTLVATAYDGYRFVQWGDHDTNATRIVTVTANATYIAHFEQNVGIGDLQGSAPAVKVYPNPAGENVIIDGLTPPAAIHVVDATGREVTKLEVHNPTLEMDVGRWPVGTYFLRIVTNRTTIVRKLIVK